jgi:hypothetical protein
VDNHERWIMAMEKVEERTGKAYHGAPCSCEDCSGLEALAEDEMADMLGAECDAVYEHYHQRGFA